MEKMIYTQRLQLRPMEEEDIAVLHRIQNNPDAMQYTVSTATLEQTEKRMRAYAHSEKELGFAPWTVLLRSEKRIIGWGGLNVDPFDPGWGVEVAYFIDQAYWGRGLASELVRQSLETGFKQHNLTEIHAFAHRDNAASIRVLEKNGFKFWRFETSLNRNHYLAHSEQPVDTPQIY